MLYFLWDQTTAFYVVYHWFTKCSYVLCVFCFGFGLDEKIWINYFNKEDTFWLGMCELFSQKPTTHISRKCASKAKYLRLYLFWTIEASNEKKIKQKNFFENLSLIEARQVLANGRIYKTETKESTLKTDKSIISSNSLQIIATRTVKYIKLIRLDDKKYFVVWIYEWNWMWTSLLHFCYSKKKSTIEVVLFAYFPSVFDIIQALESDIRLLIEWISCSCCVVLCL